MLRSQHALMRLIAVSVAACGAVAAIVSSAPAAAANGPGPVTPSCAWPYAVNADTIASNPAYNVSNPDTAADYWIMDFTVQQGLSITLSGRFPDSRYMSFAVYGANGAPFTDNGIGSELTDYLIAPDHGSVNPWQPGSRHHSTGHHGIRPGGRYTVTLRSDVTPGETNALPLAPPGTPAGTTGSIFFRVYVSNGSPGQVPVPTVTFTQNGISQRIHQCPPGVATPPDTDAPVHGAAPAAGSAGPSAAATSAGILPFARYTPGTNTPNPDTGQLRAAVLPPPSGDVMVIRAKAPTTPRGSQPSPWPAAGEDLRYWSMCIDVDVSPIPVVVNKLPDGTVDYGCRYDSQVRLDRNGYYTIVVGTEPERAAIERIPGATFLPFSVTYPTQPHLLFLRNMLANPAFAQAAQNVPDNGIAESAESVMGPYYPQSAICPLATLASGGPEACLSGTS